MGVGIAALCMSKDCNQGHNMPATKKDLGETGFAIKGAETP